MFWFRIETPAEAEAAARRAGWFGVICAVLVALTRANLGSFWISVPAGVFLLLTALGLYQRSIVSAILFVLVLAASLAQWTRAAFYYWPFAWLLMLVLDATLWTVWRARRFPRLHPSQKLDTAWSFALTIVYPVAFLVSCLALSAALAWLMVPLARHSD